jgi:hypothetical protein
MKKMMKKLRKVGMLIIAVVLLTIIKSCSQAGHGNADHGSIVGQYQVKNLQVFLLNSEEEPLAKEYVVLSEAMDKGYVEIAETSDVQELIVENKSDKFVLINSGDIVKGGKQDRTVRYDVIIPPKSGKMPLASFCVESGRWQQRGEEDAGKFKSNTKFVPSNDLKLAVKYDKEQNKVWDNVSKQQEKINKNASRAQGREVDVRQNASSSSLQLTLENEDLEALIADYKEAFEGALDKHKRAVGFAYAINGRLYGIDIYGSPQLFRALWGKHLDAVVTEAISELDGFTTSASVVAVQVTKLMDEMELSEKEAEQVNGQTDFITSKDKNRFLFETIDKNEKRWIHKNMIVDHSR